MRSCTAARTTFGVLSVLAVWGLGSCGGDGAGPDPAVSSGHIAFQSRRASNNYGIYLMTGDGDSVRPVLADTFDNVEPALSPDGRWIAFNSNRSGRGAIWVVRTDGSGLAQVTMPRDTLYDAQPAWSLDGSRLAFTRSSTTGGGAGIFVVNADGSGVSQLTSLPGDREPAWSPDGTTIAFTRDSDIYLLIEGGAGATLLYGAGGSNGDAAWAPDGTVIAFGGVDSGNQEILLIHPDGTGLSNLTRTAAPLGEVQPSWAPDGAALAFAGFRNGATAIVRRAADGTGERVLTGQGFTDLHPSWSR